MPEYITDMAVELGWESVQERRQISRLCLCGTLFLLNDFLALRGTNVDSFICLAYSTYQS